MVGVSVVVLLFISWNAAGQTPAGMRARGQNAVADALVQSGVALGLDFDRDNPKASHPTRDDRRQRFEAGFGAWLDSELERADDSISEPPVALRDYLRDHRETIWSIVAALEKGSPDWGERPGEELWPALTFLPTILLEKILLSTALFEEREGHEIDAERALEASWSLRLTTDLPRNLMSRLSSNHIERWQAGVLRKMKRPPVQWMSRMSGSKPWRELLDALSPELSSPTAADPTIDEFRKAQRSVMSALLDALRKMSPCEAAGLSDEEMWSPAAREIKPNPHILNLAESLRDSTLPNVTTVVRRTARHAVDQELTLKILELRLEKTGSSNHAWPKKFEGAGSAVCPGSAYVYSAGNGKMAIRFDGTIETPEGGPVLPLSFQAGGPPLPTRTPTPTATPTPKAP